MLYIIHLIDVGIPRGFDLFLFGVTKSRNIRQTEGVSYEDPMDW